MKNIIYVLSIGALIVAGSAASQILLNEDGKEPQEKTVDEQRLDSLKAESERMKAKAEDAKDAADESKKSVNAEKKAQKARQKADEQEKKATESQKKSENNY